MSRLRQIKKHKLQLILIFNPIPTRQGRNQPICIWVSRDNSR